jgi:hypothetical protein
MPEVPGRRRSRNARSYGRRCTSERASSAPLTSVTAYPSPSRHTCREFRMRGSSSTTRARRGRLDWVDKEAMGERRVIFARCCKWYVHRRSSFAFSSSSGRRLGAKLFRLLNDRARTMKPTQPRARCKLAFHERKEPRNACRGSLRKERRTVAVAPLSRHVWHGAVPAATSHPLRRHSLWHYHLFSSGLHGERFPGE